MAHLQSMRDQPGTQREYETIYILRADATTEQIQQINERIRGVIETTRGKLLRVENWGKRKLAYQIRKQARGIYLYWRYLAPSELVAELERNLRMLDLVIRYLTVRIDENVDPDARPSDLSEESFVAAATTIADEDDSRDEPAEGGEDFEDGDFRREEFRARDRDADDEQKPEVE